MCNLSLIRLTPLLLLLSIFLGCKAPDMSADPPNVVLIITDDQGYGDLACHGNPYIQTPALDALHRECVRLTNFHVSPTCSPTRAALMTGRYNNRTGVWHTIAGWSLLRENEKTLADMFHEAGYTTGAFGKWHLGDNYPFRAGDRGFSHTVVHGGGGVQQTPDYWGNDYFDDTYLKNGEPVPYEGYCTDIFFDEALRFMEDSRDQPFFCYLTTNAPHGPYHVPLAYRDLYADIADDDILAVQRRFWGMITNIDENIGRLRRKLVDLEISDNTLLIFMTDNGTAAGQRERDGKVYGYNVGMRGAKGSQYDGGHRVPFFLYWKDGGLTGGRDIETLAAHIDVMPTLASLCGIALPGEHQPLDGMDLSPLLHGSSDSWPSRTLITDSQRIQVPEKWRRSAVMTQRWRLVDGEELYDMQADPGQRTDLAAQYPDQVKTMRSDYDQWWASISPDFADEPAFKIGVETVGPVHLTCHDWHAENGVQPWHQWHVRDGVKGRDDIGYWTLDVVEAGDYRVSLRRYPVESGLPINADTPGVSIDEEPGLEVATPPGKGLQLASGWVQFGEAEKIEGEVASGAGSLDLTVTLPQGKTTLTAGFKDRSGQDCGAYYASIIRQ